MSDPVQQSSLQDKGRATCPWCDARGVLVTLPTGRIGWVLRRHFKPDGNVCVHGSRQVVDDEAVTR